MKKTIISIFGIVYLSLSTLNAQNIEPAGKLEILVKAIDKLNKKELRDYIITLSDSIYLIETENLKLLNSQNELSANSKILENEITLNNAEIENLKEEIDKT